MYTDQRDLSIVHLVSRFRQLTTKHIQQLVFADLTSHTPADRSLKRLVEGKQLHRIERRVVGGAKGGAGQYVYQLGPEGHRLFSESRWVPARAIHNHSLAIADCYVTLRRLERAGSLKIVGYSTEPDCHVTIGRHLLKPDMYVELTRPSTANSIRLMFEVDMGTQGPRQITEKFARYWGARQVATEEEWPDDQLVLFVAVDDYRADELRWLLSKGAAEQRVLFRIVTLAGLEAALSG